MKAEIVGGLLSVEPVSMLRLLLACRHLCSNLSDQLAAYRVEHFREGFG
jgi:hypothetical protein